MNKMTTSTSTIPFAQAYGKLREFGKIQMEVFNLMSEAEKPIFLGERIYRVVQAAFPHNAEKITYLLTLQDPMEVIAMIESREAFAAKVDECIQIIATYEHA